MIPERTRRGSLRCAASCLLLAAACYSPAGAQPRPEVATAAAERIAAANVAYQAARGSRDGRRANLTRALRLFLEADSLTPSPRTKFLAGTAATTLAQMDAESAYQSGSCVAAQRAEAQLDAARKYIAAGREWRPEAAELFARSIEQTSAVMRGLQGNGCK